MDGQKRIANKLLALFGLLIVVMILSLFLGRYSIRPDEVVRLFKGRMLLESYSDLKVAEHIIFDVRLPRVLIAALVGAGLSIVGASLQGIFQNPLVSPDILGVSSGAGFGAALGILLTSGAGLITAGLSFFFGLLSVLLTLSLVRVKEHSQTMSYILAGIIVTSVFTALTSLIKYVADTEDQLPSIIFWLMGSFANKNFDDLQLIIAPILIGILGLTALRWRLNILSLGDEEAFSLGINPKRIRIAAILFSTVITAACVMASGIIGWVGLVIPHICRQLFGVEHDTLLPTSSLLGASFMVIVDCAARNLTSAEIPIGILTALIGAPFFALIYSRMKGEV
ncbi:iron ABC transporter permease [Fusibacter paucivorans]|uniref:Iron ABC transporter permease n=2 Tax=Fusibacter paucivorans TaxID=76009 RepID=A0ABS5PS95_9FIRM|nr:iron ABC transporter permease [Fusibacter paucivorans]